MDAIGLGGTVGDDIIVHHAVRCFNGAGCLTSRNAEAFGHNLEVMDERFHLGLHLFAIGKDDLWRVCDDMPFRQAIESLKADLDRLSELLHADDISGPDVANVRDRYVELKLLIAAVRHVAADVEVDAGSAQWWSGHAQGNGIRG